MTEETNGHEWYFDEHTPGNGPRPEYLKPNFKTIAEQAKAYNEARKLLGERGPAPESYDLTEFQDQVDPQHPQVQKFLDYAKEKRFEQADVATIVKTLVDYEKSLLPDEAAELAKMGPEGQKKIQVLDQWAKNNLSLKGADVFAMLPKTHEVVEFMDEIRQMQYKGRSQAPLNSDHAQSFKPLSEQEVRNEMRANYSKYLSDANYRSEIQHKLRQVLGDE